ncbi:MAG: hypothetical protein E7397_03190 [Ruminococcaceae bacterium]|nr:hypothetical protein [Oscillospiraceae bacterium]
MMYRKFYSYNDMPSIPRKTSDVPPPTVPQKQEKKEVAKAGSFLDQLESDDIILGVVILLLLMNDCEDKLLLLAIAFVFFSGFFEENK